MESSMEKCIFCDIIKKNSKNIVYQNKNLIVIKDIKPKADVHLLIISKKHIKNLKYIDSENKDMLGEMLLVIPKLSKLYKINAFKILINNGKKAQQEIDHLHFHFLGYK